VTYTLPDELVVLDTETTGLDFDKHEVWEIAFAVGEGPIDCFRVEHNVLTADLRALELNGYRIRSQGFYLPPLMELATIPPQLEGKIIVGANPSFDMYRLNKRWGRAPWHYRPIDVESVAVTVLDLDKPLGLKALVDKLSGMGYTIPQNDHTAAGDVAATREVYRILRTIGKRG
jgi:DNA polymerase III alpha subunit (gram-positive type)